MGLTICIDFDNTITADFNAARDALAQLRADGHTIIIWSSRNNKYQHGKHQKRVYGEMMQALEDNKIPFDGVDNGESGKFHAQIYIDDKAIHFHNNWDEIIESIY